MTVELKLFAGLSILADGQLVTGVAAQPRRLAVLAVLAEAWPSAVSRERVVGLIWPDQTESNARRLLTQALYELRRELGEFTQASGRELAIDPTAITVDLIEFRRALECGDVERALQLHRRPFLDGFYVRGADEFERWSAGVRDATQRELIRAIERAAASSAERGDLREAMRWSEQVVALSPYDADAALRFIDLADQCGDRASALRVATMYEERLREELSLEPDPRVTSRAAMVRTSEHRLPTPLAIPAVPAVPVVVAPAASPAPAVVPPSRSRRVVWASLGACLLAASAFGARIGARRASAQPARILSLDVRGEGDSAAAEMAAALKNTLSASLDRSGGVRIAPDGDSLRGWAALHASVLVTGRQARLDARIDIRGEPSVFRSTVVGSRDSLIALSERLAMEMLPAVYPELRQLQAAGFSRRFRSVAVARRYLDGEIALHRGGFEEAYQSFRAATDLDSMAAYAWYSRALAAEDAHRIDDADRSAILADARSNGLPARDRALIHAYAVWRSGDIRGADSLYRQLIAAQPNDAEAWLEFAEVAYHGGPLIGRPLDDANDPWRRAVALDTNSFPALMHLVRLEARAAHVAELEVLNTRAERIGSVEPLASEASAISAAAGATPWNARAYRGLPDASAHFVHAIIAGFLERPDLAAVPARVLTESSRPAATRAEGFLALAAIAVAEGRLGASSALLDSVARDNPVAAASWRAYFASLPFLPAQPDLLSRAAAELDERPYLPTAAPLFLEVAVDAAAASTVHAYNRALVGGASARFAERCEVLPSPSRELCDDLGRGVAANEAMRAGNDSEALAQLERISMRVPYQLAGRSVYFARTRERFLRAMLLERAGRLDEAYDWYAAAPKASRLDYVYLAASHLAQGRIRERQGDRAAAASHYGSAARLWANADGAFAGLRREAELGLTRVR